jgi:hypothetical protein
VQKALCLESGLMLTELELELEDRKYEIIRWAALY